MNGCWVWMSPSTNQSEAAHWLLRTYLYNEVFIGKILLIPLLLCCTPGICRWCYSNGGVIQLKCKISLVFGIPAVMQVLSRYQFIIFWFFCFTLVFFLLYISFIYSKDIFNFFRICPKRQRKIWHQNSVPYWIWHLALSKITSLHQVMAIDIICNDFNIFWEWRRAPQVVLQSSAQARRDWLWLSEE